MAKADTPVIDELYAVIVSRKGGDPESSHTARLFAQGRSRIAQKLGEEAVETAIEAVKGNADGVRSESADLLYHLLVLWASYDIQPEDVWRELAARRGISGIEEKKSRKANKAK